jgi:hypothetical protein
VSLLSKFKNPGRCGRGFFLLRIFRNYRATRNFDSDVPIELKAVTAWLAWRVSIEAASVYHRSCVFKPSDNVTGTVFCMS